MQGISNIDNVQKLMALIKNNIDLIKYQLETFLTVIAICSLIIGTICLFGTYYNFKNRRR